MRKKAARVPRNRPTSDQSPRAPRIRATNPKADGKATKGIQSGAAHRQKNQRRKRRKNKLPRQSGRFRLSQEMFTNFPGIVTVTAAMLRGRSSIWICPDIRGRWIVLGSMAAVTVTIPWKLVNISWLKAKASACRGSLFLRRLRLWFFWTVRGAGLNPLSLCHPPSDWWLLS